MGLNVIKTVGITAAFGILAGCSSPLGGAILSAAVEFRDGQPEAAAPVAPRINRAAIKEADVAAIFVSSAETGARALTIAVAKRRGGITYISQGQRSVVMRGGLISTTRGFGSNLQATETAQNDPLVNDTPPAAWPTATARTYLFSGQGPDFVAVAAQCTVTVPGDLSVDVLGVERSGTVVTENCTTDTGVTFENEHLIAQDSGKIWVSTQWTGPIQGMLTLQVVEPFEDD